MSINAGPGIEPRQPNSRGQLLVTTLLPTLHYLCNCHIVMCVQVPLMDLTDRYLYCSKMFDVSNDSMIYIKSSISSVQIF